MRIIRAADQKIMPWKNGGGSTAEIAIYPEDATLGGGFLWRLSVATVSADGPFSRFPGYARHIMLLEGNGMVLEREAGGNVSLAHLHVPQLLAGEDEVYGRLVDGPVKDFNLMVNHSLAQSDLAILTLERRTVVPAGRGYRALYLLEGDIVANSHVLAAGETLVLELGEAASLEPLGGPAVAADAQITIGTPGTS